MMKLNIQLFASGTITFATDEKLQGKIEWSSVSNGSEANTSTVTTKLYAHKTDSYTTKGASWKGNVKVGSNAAHSFGGFSSSKTIGSSWVLFATYTDTVTHNADGTMTVNISGWVNGPSGTSLSGARSSGNADVVLDIIPRASQPSLSSSTATMGSPVTIYTNRASDSFTHTIRYAFGNASGTIATGVGASTSWTPPVTLAQQISSATSGTGTIYCDTYSGASLIGTKSVGITLTVPASVIPSISIGTITEANGTMTSLNWGVFVQNKSRLSIPITASGSQGSWITGTTTTVNGSNYSGTSVTTEIINASGSVGISSTTTDSRGRQASTSATVTFVAYSNPTITTAIATRCLSDGTDSDEGTYLKYSFVGSISSVSNHNAHRFRLWYKEKSAASYSNYQDIDTANYSVNKSNQVLNLNLDTSKSYDIKFEAHDTFTDTIIERVIDTGFDLMNFNPSGKAMAIGKVSEAGANEELFEVGLPMKVVENIAAPIPRSLDVSWINGRIASVVRQNANSTGGWQPVASANTNNGDWSIGTLGGNEHFFMAYTTDNDYETQTNNAEVIEIYPDRRTTLIPIENFIQVAISSGQSIDQEYVKINFDAWSNGNGSMLTLDSTNHRVVIGAGVSKVKVSAKVFMENVGSWLGYAWILIRKNGTTYSTSIQSGVAQYYQTVNLAPIVMNVTQGDYIEIFINNSNHNTGAFSIRSGADNTSMLVEVIG